MSVTSLLQNPDLLQFANLLCHIRINNPTLDLAALASSMQIDHNEVVSIFSGANAVCSHADADASESPSDALAVKHWSRYNDTSAMTHLVEVEDERLIAGRISVYAGAIDIAIDDPLWVTMEVSHDPHGAGQPVPAAHVSLDGEGMSFSLFKLNGEVLLVPEEGVEVTATSTGRGQTAYRVGSKF